MEDVEIDGLSLTVVRTIDEDGEGRTVLFAQNVHIGEKKIEDW